MIFLAGQQGLSMVFSVYLWYNLLRWIKGGWLVVSSILVYFRSETWEKTRYFDEHIQLG